MQSALLFLIVMAIIVGPALVGVRQLKDVRDYGVPMSTEDKLKIGGLFGPMAIFILSIFLYLAAMFMMISRQS